jgi:hypothetical protein
MEATPDARNTGVAEGREESENAPMYHAPTISVYEKLPSDDGRVHIRVPDKTLEKASLPGLSRRNRALLAIAAKRGEGDFSRWSSAHLAKLFGASLRSISEASKLSSKELQDVANERRPLFQRAAPAPSPDVFDANAAMDQIINKIGRKSAMRLLAAKYRAAMNVEEVA